MMTAPGTSGATAGRPMAASMSRSAGANAAGRRSATDCEKIVKRVSHWGTDFGGRALSTNDAPVSYAAL